MKLKTALYQLASSKFVPQASPACEKATTKAQDILQSSERLLVLTGAGLSTESGIPDYRSEGVGLYARTDRRPVQYQDYVKKPSARQSYWARNYIGWPKFASFQPNISHHILSDWERQERIKWLVTQNVDALHTKAGSERVTELHGCSHRVLCLNCDYKGSRWELQKMIKEYNPSFSADASGITPDGDVILSDEKVKEFTVPPCPSCNGILKPDVIFFGDCVPKPTVEFVFQQVEDCDSVLVAGSSLFVYSGYRFIRRAKELNKPVVVINIGETRADNIVDVKVDARCGEILPKLKLS